MPDAGVLLYDGDCAFCTSSAQWIAARWADGPRAVAWQSLGPAGLEAIALSATQVATAAWWVDPDGCTSRGHRAVGHALVHARARHYRALGRVALLPPPVAWLAAAAYALVARNRHRLPGGKPDCRTSSG